MTARLDEGACLVAAGAGYDLAAEGERTSPAPRPRRAETPEQGGHTVTIVWILIVIILVLLVIGLARRVL
jgi:hypothetical protein